MEAMTELKFRIWDKEENKFFEPIYEAYKGRLLDLSICLGGDIMRRTLEFPAEHESNFPNRYIKSQYLGLKDIHKKEYYVGDIGQFDNGDRFVLKMEWFLQVYVDWIGDADCEDQARDLYRIEQAKIIGNIYQNPELLNETNI